MPAKSIQLTDDELAALDDLSDVTGEPAEVVLKRAALRGVKELRLEQGLLAYLQGADSADAAVVAGLPRVAFLDRLVERGIPLLAGPSTLASELDFLARRFGSSRLAAAAASLAETDR